MERELRWAKGCWDSRPREAGAENGETREMEMDGERVGKKKGDMELRSNVSELRYCERLSVHQGGASRHASSTILATSEPNSEKILKKKGKL